MRIARRLLPFVAAALFFTATGFLPGRVLLPLDLPRDFGAWKENASARQPVSNALLSDVMLQFLPWDTQIRRSLSDGELPWINPWAGDGQPLFANPQTALLHPTTWPRLLLGPSGWALSVFLRLLLAGLAGAWLCREMGGRGLAPLISGLIYLSCGFTIGWGMHPHANVVAALPALAASILRLRVGVSPGRVLAVVGLAALATAGGHPETLAIGVVGIGAFLLWELRSESSAGESRLRLGVLAAAAAGAGFALMAVQVVPFLGILAASDSAAARPTLGLPVFRLSSIVGQALPGALGGPLGYELDLSRAIAGGGSFLSRSEGFLGVIALISIAAAWRRLAPTFRRGAIVGAAAMVVAWCPPGVSWIWRRLPLLGLAGEHYAYVVWAIFGAAAAGPALALLAEEAQPRRLGAALAGGGILLAAAGLAPVVAGEEALRKTALGAVERMRARGTLRNPTAVYAARLATYLKSGRATAVRRLAVPGILWAAGGLLLASRRPRGALPWIAVGELFASSAGYYPAMRKSDAPPLPAAIADVAARDPDRQFLLAAGSGIYPPNLATMVPLRDLRRFDEIEPVGAMASLREAGYRRPDLGFPEPVAAAAARRLARAGVRFVLARSPVETSERVGGDPPPGVGLYELAGAEPRPKPANEPPRGLVSGVILSGAAAVAAFLLAWRSSSRAAI